MDDLFSNIPAFTLLVFHQWWNVGEQKDRRIMNLSLFFLYEIKNTWLCIIDKMSFYVLFNYTLLSTILKSTLSSSTVLPYFRSRSPVRRRSRSRSRSRDRRRSRRSRFDIKERNSTSSMWEMQINGCNTCILHSREIWV